MASQHDGKQIKSRTVPLAALNKDVIYVRGGSTLASTSLADVTSIVLALRSGPAYIFEMYGTINCSGATSIVGLGINFTGTPVFIQHQGMLPQTASVCAYGGANASNVVTVIDSVARANNSVLYLPFSIQGQLAGSTSGNLSLRAQRSGTATVIVSGWAIAYEV